MLFYGTSDIEYYFLKVPGQQQFNICFNSMVLWTFKSPKAVSLLNLCFANTSFVGKYLQLAKI